MPFKKGKITITSEVSKKSTEPIQLTNFGTHANESNPTSIFKIEDEPPSHPSSILSKILEMKAELLVFVYVFSFALRSVSQTTIIIDKVCLVHFNYSADTCSNLANHSDIKHEVVKLANNYILGYSWFSNLTSAILVIFIGSWSDKYSRRIPVIAGIVGIIIDDIGITLLSVFMNTRVEFLFIPALFNGLSGGMVAFMTVIYSYVSDTSTVSNRTMKYTIMQASTGLSAPIGMLAGGYIFMYFGYSVLFLISTAGHVVALFCAVFFIKETRGLENKDSWSIKLRNLFSTENVVASFRATVKERPNQGRKQIGLLVLSVTIILLPPISIGTIGFSYVHHRYNWDNTKYSTVFSIFIMIGTIATLFIVPIFKKMKLGDSTLGFAGAISVLSKSLLTGLASYEYLFYIAYLVGVLETLVPLAAASRISKIVPQDDIGKIFSFLSMVEFVFPSICTAAVSQIFNASLSFFPGLIFIILGITSLIPIGIFLWITRLPKADYDESEDVPDNTMKTEVDPATPNDIQTTELTEPSRF